ncbi:hypothetical protein B0H17DRAFT_1092007 [Mycena rosella]|uniref:chitin deacetylase n=1 Tax=Mycena rosella TaxID=1033263 RepID=A0AAD7CUC3_MYCRO|nr:hypothetical protein B0H17DRAFT_1092007 [Mycena rosella]
MRHGTFALLLLLSPVASVLADNRTTEAEEAAINDPTAECVPYSYARVSDALTSFPAIGKNVTALLPNDAAGHAKFQSISPGIPNIAPRGTLGGDFLAALEAYNLTDTACWWILARCINPVVPGLSVDLWRVPESRTVGYAFEDGPSCSHNRLYNFLAEQGQTATMFFVGSNVMKFPLEAQRAVVDGHEICAHTWSNPAMTAATNEGAFAELWYTIQAIKLVTGVTPTCWRPPLGDVDDRIRYISSQLGLTTIMWYDESLNMVVNDAVQGYFDSNVGPILRTQPLNNVTMQTAIYDYRKLTAAFDHIVPIGVALNKTQPYAETNYTLPNFAACACPASFLHYSQYPLSSSPR